MESNEPKSSATDLAPPKETQSNKAVTHQHASTAEAIPAEVASILGVKGGDLSSAEIFQAIQISRTMFGGPIPPPSVLAEYNEVMPGLAKNIVGWTEKQTEHRQSLERQRIEGAERRMNRGQIMAGVIAFAGICSASFVGIYGNAIAASIIVIATVGGPVAAIVLAHTFGQQATKKQKNKRKEE